MMEEGVVFTKESLSVSEVEHILQHPPTITISTPPARVKGGQVYVFKAENQGIMKQVLRLRCLLKFSSVE